MLVIIAMAGLPGAGKSTLACALATRLHAVVLDKDRIRAGLFPPSHVDYTSDQNDFCVDVMYRTTEWLLRRDHAAGNRDAALYRQLQAAAHPITDPKLIIDTGRPVSACVVGCASYATSGE